MYDTHARRRSIDPMSRPSRKSRSGVLLSRWFLCSTASTSMRAGRAQRNFPNRWMSLGCTLLLNDTVRPFICSKEILWTDDDELNEITTRAPRFAYNTATGSLRSAVALAVKKATSLPQHQKLSRLLVVASLVRTVQHIY